MIRKIILILSVVIVPSVLGAREKVDLFGYFETQWNGVRVHADFHEIFSNKLRIDLKSSLSDRITFAANVNFKTFHGKKAWNILDFLPEPAAAQVPEGMEAFYVLPFPDEFILDNAYVKLSFKPLDLVLGKQQISVGTGYVWNPTDIFNIKDLLDPTYEQPGHNALRLDLPIGISSSLSLIYSPDDKLKNSAKMIRIKGTVFRFDFSLLAAEKIWRFHDYTRFDFGRMSFLEEPERRRLLGLCTAGELLGIGVWAEYAYNRMEKTKDFHEFVAGSDYTFDFQTYIMVEYYRNTLGKTDFQKYSLNDWMRMMTYEQKAVSRDQVYIFLKHPLSDFVDLGLSVITSISDGSLALVPLLNSSFSDNVEVMAYLNVNLGREGTLFSKTTGHAGLLRLRVYF